MKSYEEYYTEIMDSLFNRRKKQKGISIWVVVFTILFVVHVIFFYWVGTTLGRYTGAMILIVAIPLAILLAFIDFIAVFTYIIKRHPHGIVKVVSYIVLAIIGLMLVLSGIWLVKTHFYPLYPLLLLFYGEENLPALP
jgi:apolipoprotein N-acyltransferase